MLNKKRIVIFVTFLCCLFFMTTFAGAPAQNTIIATRTVEFVDGYNNRTISEQTIEVGTDAVVPSDPVHEGYIFSGWYLFDDQDVKVTDFTNVLNDTKVIAKYQEDANRNGIADDEEPRYIVTFIDSIDGRTLKTEEVLTGMSATAPVVPTHDGYTFTGWSAGYANVTGNIIVRTVFTNNTTTPTTPGTTEPEVNYYNVVFIDTLTNRVIASERIAEGLTASTPETPIHEGYLFIRWNGDFTNITSDREIYTVYALDENNNGIDDRTETKYTITFNAGENGMIVTEDGKEKTIEINNILTGTEFGKVVENLPTIEANNYYVVDGWNENIPNNDFKITENLTFTAKYLEDKNNNGIADNDSNEIYYDVKFYDTISNLQIGETQKVLSNMPATAPTPKEYDRKLFIGWNKEFTNVSENLTINTIYVDDLNNNGIDDLEEQETKKTLTIEYVSIIPETNPEEYIELINSKKVELLPGQTETFFGERIEWYTLDIDQAFDGITITMPNEDTRVRFLYTPGQDKNNNGIDDRYEDDTKVTLSFEYRSLNPTTKEYNELTPENPLETMKLLPGETYEVSAPTITNYKVNATSAIQKGTMGNVNKTIIFTYRPIEDNNKDGIADEDQNLNTLTIKYITTDESTLLDTEVINYVLESTTYNVQVKAFEGYTFLEAQTGNLNITMPGENYTFKVYYLDNGTTKPEIIEKDITFNYNVVENNQIVNKKDIQKAQYGWTLENKFDLTNYTKSYELDGYKYTFNGWKTIEGTLLTDEEFNQIKVNEDLEFFANYDKTPIEYQLTINYNYPVETKLNTKYTALIPYGTYYKVESPIIEGYVAVPRIVEGTMDTIGGKTINVDYVSTKPTLNITKENGYKERVKLEITATAYTDEDLYKNNNIEKYYVNGIETTNEYEITENGEYIVKIVDRFGNTNETTITINTIDKTAPVINITGDANTKYKPAIHLDGQDKHNYIEIPYNIDEENIEKIEYAKGNFTTIEEYKNNAQNRTTITDKNGNIKVTVDGYYTIYVLDKAGHETIKIVHISGIKENKWYSFAYKNLTTEDEKINIYLSTTSQLNPRNRTIELTTKNANLLNVRYYKDTDKLDISYFKNKGIDTTSKFVIEGNKDDVFSIYFKYEVNGIIKEDIVYTKLWVD